MQKRLVSCNVDVNVIQYSDNYLASFLANIVNSGLTNAEITVPLEKLNNVWRTLEMFLITIEINFFLTWSSICIISEGDMVASFAATYTNLCSSCIFINSR